MGDMEAAEEQTQGQSGRGVKNGSSTYAKKVKRTASFDAEATRFESILNAVVGLDGGQAALVGAATGYGGQYHKAASRAIFDKSIKAAQATEIIPNCIYGCWEDGKRVTCEHLGWEGNIKMYRDYLVRKAQMEHDPEMKMNMVVRHMCNACSDLAREGSDAKKAKQDAETK